MSGTSHDGRAENPEHTSKGDRLAPSELITKDADGGAAYPSWDKVSIIKEE